MSKRRRPARSAPVGTRAPSAQRARAATGRTPKASAKATVAHKQAPRTAASSSGPWHRMTFSDLAVVLLFGAPAIIVPGGLDRFVFGKLFFAALAVAVAFRARATGRLDRAVAFLLTAGAAVLVVSAILSDSPQTAFLGRAPVNEGVFVLTTYLLVGMSAARLLGPGRSPRTTRLAFDTMAVCVAAVAALAVLEAAGLRPLSSDLDRPGSLLGNASDQGALAVLYGAPLLVQAIRGRRPMHILGACAALVAIVLSASRGALIGLLVVLVVVAVAGGRRLRLSAVGVLLAAGTFALAVPYTRDRMIGLSPLAGETVSGRNLLWRETLSLLARHPVLGVGPSQFENAIVGEHDLKWQMSIGPANPPGSPHNWLLQAVAAGGFLLLAVAVSLCVLVVRRGVRAVRAGDDGCALGLLAGLAGYGAALLFHRTSPGTTIPAVAFAGSLLASAPRAQRSDVWLRRAVPVVAGLLTICFLLASVAEVWLRLGDVAVAQGRLARADSAYNHARAFRPWDPDLPAQALHQFVADATAGNAAAIPYAKKWVTGVGAVADDEQVRHNRAALLDAEADYAAALRLLTTQLRTDPYNPMFLTLRGVVEAQLSDYAGARRDLELSTRVDPSDAQAWHDLVIVYNALGDADLAAIASRKEKQLTR